MTRNRSRRGQAIVEFALAAPVFLLILFVLVDFGRVVYTQNALTQAADSAARYASTEAATKVTDTVARDAAIRARARVVPVDLPDSAITGQNGGTFYPGGAVAPAHAYVEINFSVRLLTPFVSDVVGGSITLHAKADELIR